MVDKTPASEAHISKTSIEGLLIITRPMYPDHRGGFQELWRVLDLAEFLSREVILKQGNFSISLPGVVRGLHAEPQDKVITPLTGKMRAAIVDIRKDSPTFKKVELIDFDNSELLAGRKSLFLSAGLANSICVLGKEPVLYVYAVSSVFDPKAQKRAVRWNDPALNIDWGVNEPILSKADKNCLTLDEVLKDE